MQPAFVQVNLHFHQVYLHDCKPTRCYAAAMEDWNELRFVLAVARSGALTAAAKALGIDHSTAFRRLNALEARLGVRLFERLPGGAYLPTPGGERMTAAAERMEEEAFAVSR